jgi:hypothetical protein
MSGAAPRPATLLAGAARPAITIAAIASFVAGVVHVVAAGDHDGDAALVWLFALCAGAQLGWGWSMAVSGQPGRRLLFAGLVINGGALLVWALTRTVGIGFFEPLEEAEAVGPPDLAGAIAAGVSVAAVLWMLARPGVTAALAPGWAGVIAAGAVLLAVPALSVGHSHEDGGHAHVDAADAAHADEHGHGEGELAAGDDHVDGHENGVDGHDDEHGHVDASDTTGTSHDDEHGHDSSTSTTHDDGHGHGTTSTTHDDGHGHPTTTTTTHPPHEPIRSIGDPRLTQEQVDIAVALWVGVGNELRFATLDDITAAGYVSMGDGGGVGEYTHYVNWAYLTDEYELDPTRIEAVVAVKNANGTMRIGAGMYMLTSGETLADAPALAGELTTWHDHGDLCFNGTTRVGVPVNGVCAAGELVDLPPMLYVWVEEQACGEFAPIDINGEVCDDAGHHH